MQHKLSINLLETALYFKQRYFPPRHVCNGESAVILFEGRKGPSFRVGGRFVPPQFQHGGGRGSDPT
jgi:hypothetical protein